MTQRSTTLRILDLVSLVLLAVATYLALFYAPTEVVMGQVQRVFYFHVATGWVALLGFIGAALAGLGYLATRDSRWDVLEVATVEISAVFFLITICLGSIWARPIWNTWWTWDPRLSSAAVTELIYIGYFMVRQGLDDPEKRARYAAVYALVGMVAAPLTFFAIRMYRTIHPVVFGGTNPAAEADMAMAGGMWTAFFFALFTFTVIFFDLLWHRIRLGRLQAEVERRQLQVSA